MLIKVLFVYILVILLVVGWVLELVLKHACKKESSGRGAAHVDG